jgi:organic radical activating enzyme
MYCSPTFSSVWQDRLKIKREPVTKPYQDDLLQWILDRSPEIDEVMLVGGEPMLMKQNYELLNGLSDQCKISIITNLSYNLPSLPCTPKLLSRPRLNTKWNVSLENTDHQFEYVRNGGEWALIEHNLRYLSQHWPDSVSINFVYSMFSAFDIVETIKTFHRFEIKKINMFPINDTPNMDVFNMPTIIRKKAAQELESARNWHFENLHSEDRDFYPIQGIDAIFDQLVESSKPTTVSLKMFKDQINQYDQYNKQKFQDLWPNVIDLVEKYL